MTPPRDKSQDVAWLEPVGALTFFVFALLMNLTSPWPWMWVVDLIACSGAAISRRHPGIGAVLTGFGLAVWLPFTDALASVGGMVFYINIFAAVRTNLPWKVPLTLGFAGLAYLSLVRNAVPEPSDRWATSVILVLFMAIAWGAGSIFRYARRGIQRERESSRQRLQSLQVALARELHDSVAQTLSSAAMRANIAMSDSAMSELTRDQLERIAEECRSSAHDLRQLLSSLRDEPDRDVVPGPLANVDSLKQSVEDQAQRLREEGFTVDVDIRLTKLSAARCQTLAAITVEAANNVIKHGKPNSRCSFAIVADDEGVLGEFTNTMKNAKQGHQGFGLTGIQERLALLNGTCSVVRQNSLWTLQARLPVGTEAIGNTSSLQPISLAGGTTS